MTPEFPFSTRMCALIERKARVAEEGPLALFQSGCEHVAKALRDRNFWHVKIREKAALSGTHIGASPSWRFLDKCKDTKERNVPPGSVCHWAFPPFFFSPPSL